METELAKKEVVTNSDNEDLIYKLRLDEEEDKKIVLDVEQESLSEIKKELMDILFGIYEEIDTIKKENTESLKINEYIERLKTIQLKFNENEEVQNQIREVSEKVHNKLDSIKNKHEISKIVKEIKEILRELDNNLYKSEPKYSLKDVDIRSIAVLYKALNDAIKTEDLKKITVARGRLIKKLKREDNNIDKAYEEVAPLVKINNILKSGNVSIEKIKEELKKDNKLYSYFKDSLVSLDTFKEKFDNEYNKLEVQRIIFLEDLLSNQLEKHKSLLDERYQREFLDKKGSLPSLVTVLPNAVSLSVKRLANSIEELKQANNNRKKIHLIGDAVKSTLEVVGTPVIYFGKFVASNWYTMYMAYKSINIAKEAKAAQEKQIAEAKAAEEAKARAEAEAKAKAEEARLQAEAERKAEQERMIQEGKDRAQAEAKARAEAAAKAQAEAEQSEAARAAREAKQAELEKRYSEATKTSTATNEQTATELKPETQPNLAPDANPTETIPNDFKFLTGTQIVGMNRVFGQTGWAENLEQYILNLDARIKAGLIDGNTQVTVTFLPADAQWFEVWRMCTVKVPLKYVQLIWGDSLDMSTYKSMFGDPVIYNYNGADTSSQYSPSVSK